MEEWRKALWGTAGAGLVVGAGALAATWYITKTSGVTVKAGRVVAAEASLLDPFLIGCYLVAALGAYMFVAVLTEWPLPGRAAAHARRTKAATAEFRHHTLEMEVAALLARAVTLRDDFFRIGEKDPQGWERLKASLGEWDSDAHALWMKEAPPFVAFFEDISARRSMSFAGRSDEFANHITYLDAKIANLRDIATQIGHRAYVPNEPVSQ